MKKFISACAFLGLILSAAWFLSCGSGGLGLGDLYDTGNSDVTGRFKDSTEGKTLPIIMPEVQNWEYFNFVWMTDPHYRPDRQDYMVQMANYLTNTWGASFILNSGDLVDRGTWENYNFFLAHKAETTEIPFYSALGNHDLYGDGWDAFKSMIGPSVTSFSYGNSYFMFIDSASCEIGRDQMDWIEDELRKSGGATHRFVLSHLCLYDSEAETPTILCDPDERLRLAGLLKKYNVDYLLCGHKHFVEEDQLDGFKQIMGGTPSPYKDPYNSKPLFWYFHVSGADVWYEKVELNDNGL